MVESTNGVSGQPGQAGRRRLLQDGLVSLPQDQGSHARGGLAIPQCEPRGPSSHGCVESGPALSHDVGAEQKTVVGGVIHGQGNVRLEVVRGADRGTLATYHKVSVKHLGRLP